MQLIPVLIAAISNSVASSATVSQRPRHRQRSVIREGVSPTALEGTAEEQVDSVVSGPPLFVPSIDREMRRTMRRTSDPPLRIVSLDPLGTPDPTVRLN